MLAACLIFTAGCANGEAAPEVGGIRVVASFYTMEDFAGKIAGEHASVRTMVPAGVEPHDWEPTPQDIAQLADADVFIYSGAGFEHWVETVLGALNMDRTVVVEASSGIELLEGECGEEGHNHSHGHDPHIWMSPMNAKAQMENIREALAEADPGNAGAYQENYNKWAAQCDALDAEYRDGLADIAREDVVVSHEAFGYLCAAYGLHQMGVEGLTPDSEPDPRHMAEMIDFVSENGVKVIFYEESVDSGVAETIAAATGAQADVLSPIEYLSGEQRAQGGDYFSVMRSNLEALKRALK